MALRVRQVVPPLDTLDLLSLSILPIHQRPKPTMGEPSAQITNTLFPPPPEYYKQFTQENLERYDDLLTRAGPSRTRSRSSSPRPSADEGRVELNDEELTELGRLKGLLEKPRSDWIHDEGRWVTFGEMSTVSHPL